MNEGIKGFPNSTSSTPAPGPGADSDVALDLGMQLAWTILKAAGSAISGFGQLVVDAFETTGGIDATESVNETYDATNDLYHNPGTVTEGTFAQPNASSRSMGNGAGFRYLGMRWTPATSGGVQSVKIDVASVSAGGDFSAKVYTENAGNPGTQVGADSGTVTISSGGEKTFTFAVPPAVTASTAFWIIIGETTAGSGNIDPRTCAAVSGFASGRHSTITSIAATGQTPEAVSEDWRIQVNLDGPAPDMSLVSNTIAASEQPRELRIASEIDAQDSPAIGTDVKLYGSIDDGASYEEVASYETHVVSGVIRVIKGTANVAGQSSSSIRIKLETLNNTYVPVRSWAVRTDATLTPT